MIKKYPKFFEPLDDEERELQEDLNNNLYKPIKNQEKEKERISKIFDDYFGKKQKRNTTFTIRSNKLIMDKFKEKANNEGLNYQTLINMLIFKYVSGDLKLKVEIV